MILEGCTVQYLQFKKPVQANKYLVKVLYPKKKPKKLSLWDWFYQTRTIQTLQAGHWGKLYSSPHCWKATSGGKGRGYNLIIILNINGKVDTYSCD